MKDSYKKRFWGCPRCKGRREIEVPMNSGRWFTLGLVWIACPACKGFHKAKEEPAK